MITKKFMVFWFILPYGLVDRYQICPGTCCVPFLHQRWRQQVSPKYQ